MKRFLLILIALIGATTMVTAQEKKPVQFSYSTERVDDSLVYLHIKAVIPKGTALFTTKKQNADDAFVTTIQIDSAKFTRPADTIKENGKLETVTDAAASATFHQYSDSVTYTVPLHVKAGDSVVIKGTVAWLGKSGDEYPSGSDGIAVEIKGGKTEAAKAGAAKEKDSAMSVFLRALAYGLGAIFTPCVFPLVPVTVSFFLKRSKNKGEGIRNAIWYSLSIMAIYTIPTFILVKIFGQTIMYTISTHYITNILFFVMFILFGISLLGGFEIGLPSSWANKTDQQASKGGMKGIFFMALTLVIVSFSCTGPIIGLLLGDASQNKASLAPAIGMFGFSFGLALPFTILALFPSLMQSLPKSGGWLNSVKVAFGFIELALAMKFLSNVDLIFGWRLLDREVFLAIWIALAVLLGLYLIGKIKFSHDSELKFISIPRIFFAIATFSFAIYMVPGLWGAPLNTFSGIFPSPSTQEFNLDALQYKIGGSGQTSTDTSAKPTSEVKPPSKLVDKLKVPYGLVAYFDLKEGIAAAKALKKPIMLDFTGHSCANCRRMENEVWKNPEVLRRMKEDFVLISLYVDERTDLPMAEQYVSKDGHKITMVGERNLDYEITKFGLNAQPLYMFMDADENPLSDIKYGYDSDVKKFIDHLETVKNKFYKK